MPCTQLEKETYAMPMETADTAVAQEREIYALWVMVTYDARVKEIDGAVLVKEIDGAE